MAKVVKYLKSHFIPQEQNGHRPHFFREVSVFGLCFAILAVFFGSVVQHVIIVNTSLFADIFPKVLVELANEDRFEYHLGRYKINQSLTRAAEMKADDMARKSYFSHTSPEGVTPWYWFKLVGYDFAYAGENLAVDFSDSSDVERAWMDSPLHRANILNSNFDEIGVATSKGFFEGRETTFVVQMFGRSRFTKTTAVSLPTEKTITQNSVIQNPETEKSVAVSENKIATSNIQILGVVDGNKLLVGAQNAVALPDEGFSVPSVVDPSVSKTRVNFLEKVATSPKTTLSYFYELIVFIVGLALVLMIFIKVRIQHPRNIAYGVGVIALVGFLSLAYQSLIAISVSIL